LQQHDDLFLHPASQPELADLAPSSGPRRATFADAAPPDARGAWIDDGNVVVRLDELELTARGAKTLAARAPHFAEDAAAAAAAMAFIGAGDVGVERALAAFTLDAHRLDPVGSANGVLVVDDSKATNPHATLAALRSFPVSRRVVLIAGGADRGVDLTSLAAEAARLRAVVALGETAPEIGRIFGGAGVGVRTVGTMAEAVGVALAEAREGDVILLSPACASLDMYASYAERGEAFRRACAEHGIVA
jgi:UDP-N-acetylmuramoylalanine--D-glutamate ligase